MEEHSIEEHLFHACGCSLICRRCCATEGGKERALRCVLFLAQAMYLEQKTSSAFVKIPREERTVIQRVPSELACGMNLKQSSFSPGQKQSSINEVADAKHSITCLHILNIIIYIVVQ